MGAQGLDGRIIARQFTFGQGGVYLAVADIMQAHGVAPPPAFQPGHKMVQALLYIGRYRATAKGTDRIGHG